LFSKEQAPYAGGAFSPWKSLLLRFFSLQHSIQFPVPIQWMVRRWVLVHNGPVKGPNMSALLLEVSKTQLTHSFVPQNFQVYHGAFQVVPTTS